MTVAADRRTQGGFTLIEILLAVAITAVIMTAVGAAFLGILQAREEVRALSDSTSAGPRILALIERDLNSIWHHNIRENRVFLGRNLDIAGAPADRMDFLCTTDAIIPIDDGTGRPTRPSLCEVGYWLKPNDRIGELSELWRREDPMVDGDLTSGGQFQLVHDRVKTFEITYYRTLGAKAEPYYEWDSSQRNELPRRIKIELTVERTLPNRNRVSGNEFDEFDETITKYTRHIVFDDRYPEILKSGIAMLPILPRPPVRAAEGPLGGNGGLGGGQGAGAGAGPGGPGGLGSGGPTSTSRGEFTTQTGSEPNTNRRPAPQQGPPPERTINFGDLLKGGGSGGGLFGSGGLFGGGGR